MSASAVSLSLVCKMQCSRAVSHSPLSYFSRSSQEDIAYNILAILLILIEIDESPVLEAGRDAPDPRMGGVLSALYVGLRA